MILSDLNLAAPNNRTNFSRMDGPVVYPANALDSRLRSNYNELQLGTAWFESDKISKTLDPDVSPRNSKSWNNPMLSIVFFFTLME